jgi:Uncharacterized alpha/beta hydrolase domain (DUF2235)
MRRAFGNWRRKRPATPASLTEQEKWLLKYSQPANVKVIGVWDTVGSVGLAAGNIAGHLPLNQDYASIS